MPDKQLPALPAGPLSGASTYDGGTDSRLPERPWSSFDTYSYANVVPSGRPGHSEPVATHAPLSNYLGSSIVLAPLASFASASSLSDFASPLSESTMPLSSTPTQSLSLPRGSGGGSGGGVPTLSVALPSPYLLGSSSKLAEQAPAPSEPIEPPIPEEWAAGLVQPCLLIEYCDRCRWQHRATWIQTELLLTFSAKESDDSQGGYLASTMLIPRVAPDTAGRFRVWLAAQEAAGHTQVHLLWDRKSEGGFPELKELVRRSH